MLSLYHLFSACNRFFFFFILVHYFTVRHIHTGELLQITVFYNWTLNCSTGTAESQTLSHGKDTAQFKDVFVDINTIMSVPFTFFVPQPRQEAHIPPGSVRPLGTLTLMWDTDNRHDAKAC